jgi:hypothetical protein
LSTTIIKPDIVNDQKFENPHSIRILKAKVNFCPYYLIHYVLNVNRKDPTGKNHHIHQRGTHILNAFTLPS